MKYKLMGKKDAMETIKSAGWALAFCAAVVLVSFGTIRIADRFFYGLTYLALVVEMALVVALVGVFKVFYAVISIVFGDSK